MHNSAHSKILGKNALYFLWKKNLTAFLTLKYNRPFGAKQDTSIILHA